MLNSSYVRVHTHTNTFTIGHARPPARSHCIQHHGNLIYSVRIYLHWIRWNILSRWALQKKGRNVDGVLSKSGCYFWYLYIWFWSNDDYYVFLTLLACNAPIQFSPFFFVSSSSGSSLCTSSFVNHCDFDVEHCYSICFRCGITHSKICIIHIDRISRLFALQIASEYCGWERWGFIWLIYVLCMDQFNSKTKKEEKKEERI